MIGVISWFLFGLIVGGVAKFFMPGVQNMGCLMTVLLGVVGSFVGGGISALIFGRVNEQINPAGWIMSIVGALIVLYVVGQMQKKGPAS